MKSRSAFKNLFLFGLNEPPAAHGLSISVKYDGVKRSLLLIRILCYLNDRPDLVGLVNVPPCFH
jgi:hypothetical protein